MSETVRHEVLSIAEQMRAAVLGQDDVIHGLLLALLCNGNVLLEGVPGTAKTRSVKTLANVLGVSLGRVQFTPDLLPADVTGSETLVEGDGSGQLKFVPGPIFNSIVLADEINRAPAKVQSALLEAMEERQVTVGGESYPLPALFLVLATQNPIEQEGTYPLPEAQLDRFLFKLHVPYPNAESERQILQMMQREELGTPTRITPVAADTLFAARDAIQQVTVSAPVEKYMVDLVTATRQGQAYSAELGRWLALGASPRGSIALHRASRAEAWLKGRDHVLPEDVQAVTAAVLRHRITLSYDALAEGLDADTVIASLLAQVAVG